MLICKNQQKKRKLLNTQTEIYVYIIICITVTRLTTHFCTNRNNGKPIFLSQNTPIFKNLIDATPTTTEQRLTGLDSEPL